MGGGGVCANQAGASPRVPAVARRSSCVAGRSVAAAFVPIRQARRRAFRGGLWRARGRSVARRSSRVAGRSAAAAFLPISKPRAFRGGLWREEVVALRGGLWRRRRFCQSASRARSGAVCGGGGGLWREEVVALRGGLWREEVVALRGGLWRRR